MTLNRVLVIGGGPAGMVAAVALARRGIDVEIVEIEESFTAVGVGVNIQNSPFVRSRRSESWQRSRSAVLTTVVNMVDMNGVPIMPAVRPPSLIPGGPSSIGIGRGVLASILARAVGAEAIAVGSA